MTNQVDVRAIRESIATMGNEPRTHDNCMKRYGVARPGKTASDHAQGVGRKGPNRRVWDAEFSPRLRTDGTWTRGQWLKV